MLAPREVRTRGFDERPEGPRVVEPPQMHQLVDQDIVAHRRGHQDEPPVQADETVASARAPARALVANADAAHAQRRAIGAPQMAVESSELEETIG
jgi:hypothetical protein